MARSDVELFVRDHAANKNGLQDLFKSKPDDALAIKEYAGLTADEKALLKRKNALEIGDYLMEPYRTSLSINIP